MKPIQFFHKQLSKRKRYLITIISCLLYILLAVLLGLSSEKFGGSYPLFTDSFALRGVITQFQMMISVCIVLVLNKEGYLTAVILNTTGLAMAVLYLLKSNSPASVPGIISYISVLLISTIIMKYKEQVDDYLNQNNRQKKQLEQAEKVLYHRAHYDSLTKLPNREHFIKELELELENAEKQSDCLGVAFIDMDSFKSINDMLGHLAGDEVLIEVSRRFAVPDRNFLVARSGGDEFFVLFKDVGSTSDIEKDLVRIMKLFDEPFSVQGIEFNLSASAGVAVYPTDGTSAAELIKNADMSMYEAKKKGKKQYLFCNESMKADAIRKMVMTNSLYRALENDEFILHYQPQIHLATGAIIGFEALIRWNHPDYGMIMPGAFISLAEQTGLIKPIGLWTFKTVCEECGKCNNEYKKNIRISINFSVEQLKDASIVKDVTRIIEETGTNPRNIEIEITESIAFSKDTAILEKLMQLNELGFMIAIDDFGKEYSALNRIRSLPVDLLKIDMEFIFGITSGNPKDRAIVKTIIQLAKNLDIKVLAEGVETQEQYDFLIREKCDEAQGFYFYKGMPASEAQSLLMTKGTIPIET